MKNKKIILSTFLFVILTYICCLILPWWVITIIGMTIGFCASSFRHALIQSSSIITFVWLSMLINNFYFQPDKQILISKMKVFLNLNDILLIIITLIIPFFISLIASYFGWELRKAVQDD